MPTSEEYKRNAENCEELAADAKRLPDKSRYSRMQRAWLELAETQDWLDGKTGQQASKSRAQNPEV